MKEIISQTRTYRKFDAGHRIPYESILEIIELARLAGSARNCQPWQYLPVIDQNRCDAIFPHLAWAGYLTDWKGPTENQRPTAYILCFLNTQWLKVSRLEAAFDLGIASQNMLIGATSLGLGGCRIGAFSPKLAKLFDLPEHLELAHVIALGKPAEKVVLEECQDENIKYWRDENSVHHVPKRKLSDILLSSDIYLK